MVEPVRHRQTKGAATDMFDLQPPRHTSTLPTRGIGQGLDERPAWVDGRPEELDTKQPGTSSEPALWRH